VPDHEGAVVVSFRDPFAPYPAPRCAEEQQIVDLLHGHFSALRAELAALPNTRDRAIAISALEESAHRARFAAVPA
jgi:hypothetical protein